MRTIAGRIAAKNFHPVHGVGMARKSSLFQSSERFVALEKVLKWLEEVLKWLEEVLNLPPNFSPFLLNT